MISPGTLIIIAAVTVLAILAVVVRMVNRRMRPTLRTPFFPPNGTTIRGWSSTHGIAEGDVLQIGYPLRTIQKSCGVQFGRWFCILSIDLQKRDLRRVKSVDPRQGVVTLEASR